MNKSIRSSFAREQYGAADYPTGVPSARETSRELNKRLGEWLKQREPVQVSEWTRKPKK